MGNIKRFRWKIVEWLTIKATDLSGLLLRDRKINLTFTDFCNFPKQSLGRCYYEKLLADNIPFNPRLIRHDLKHILLQYDMKMPDELRIHAFLIGNRSYNWMAIIYLLVCVMIVPESIKELKTDYKRGKKAVKLKSINFLPMLNVELEECQKQFNILPL